MDNLDLGCDVLNVTDMYRDLVPAYCSPSIPYRIGSAFAKLPALGFESGQDQMF